MTVKEIDKLARQKTEIDYTGTISDIGLYYKLRLIYQAFDNKEMTVKEAGKAKRQALEDYEHETAKDREIEDLMFRITQHQRIFAEDERRRTKTELAKTEAIKCGCEHCRKLVFAIDGLK